MPLPVRSQDIEIPEPCHADWDAMRPEERGRFCFDCRKKVHDLSAMTEREAEAFLERTECEDVCISYEHESDGTLVFRAPPPAPVVPLSRLRRPRRIAAAVAGAGVAAALAACAPHGEPPQIREAEVVAFESPAVVIPHEAAPTSETAPPPEVDTPCELEPEVEVEEPPEVIEKPRVRGRRPFPRTAGKPVVRRKGGKPARIPTASSPF